MPIRKAKKTPEREQNSSNSVTVKAPRVGLAEALASPDVSQRLAALSALDGNCTAGEVAILCDALASEPESVARDRIAVCLARTGGEPVVECLLPLLRSDNAAVRNIAIDILKELPAAVAPRMEALLDDPDPDVRIFVVNVLEALRHPAVENWLIAVVNMDPHPNVVATALDLLIEVGTPASVPALRKALARFPDEPFLAFSAESALRRIGAAV